jgi:hypothetical protein
MRNLAKLQKGEHILGLINVSFKNGTRSPERGWPGSCRSSGATTRGRGDDEIWRATLGRGVVGAEGTEEATAALDERMGRRGKEAQQGTHV